MGDLIGRLRIVAAIERLPERGLAAEAADALTTLEAKLAVAREALEYVCAADEVEYARLYARQALQEIEQ